VVPVASLDGVVEKREFLTIPGLELRPVGRPARSQSLYRIYCRCNVTVSLETVLNRLCLLNISFRLHVSYIYIRQLTSFF
jgi:hypothetical protein